jgi:hypothetical protein
MKTIAFLLLIGTLGGMCEAQPVEPYGDMAKSVTMIFKEDKAVLEGRIIENLGRLQGVEIDSKTGKPKIEKKVWRPHWPRESSLATNAAQMEMESITVWWTPPKPPPQKVSEGGSNIKPVRSEIWIVVGCLKTNHQASVIRLRREWTYNARNHVPYTEIPLFRGNSSNGGGYPSDHDWLHQLASGKEYPIEYDDLAYDSKILDVLKTLPSKKEQ